MNNTIFFFIKGLVLFFLFHLIFSSCHSVNGYRIPSEHIIPDTIIAREKLEQARLLMDSALYNQAIEQTEKALAIYRKTVGEIDTLTAAGYILESDIYLEIFNYNKALKIAKKAKDICTKEVGEVHFLTAKSNFNIGYAKERLGDKEEGLKHYEKALKLLPANKEEKLFIGKVYRRVGIIYRNSNEFDLATKYFNQAINLYLNNSEENHPDLANTYVSIGLAHDRKFEFEKAISKFQKAQQIFSRIYSPNHPNMAKLYRNIGTVKAKQGLYNEARENYEKALEAYKKYFGGEHVLVGGIYHNLGVVCNKKADYNRALLYFKHSLEIKQGRKDASIYTTYNGIGNAMQLAGRYDEALLHFQMALNEYKSIYGNKGEGLGIIYDNIGIVYERKGDYDNAYRYFQQALNIKRHELGERNPKTAETYFSLGSLSRKIGELDSALLFYNKALEINRLELGEKHQKVANVYNDIGIVYRQQKAYNEALIMFQKAKTIFSDTFGDKHPNVASTLQNIGLVYKDIEEFDVAVSYLRKAGQALRYRSNAPKEFSNVTNLNRLQSIFHSLTELYSDQLKRTKQQGYQDNLNECYNNWLALEEYIQLEYTNPDTRQYYTSTSLPVYDDAINAAYKSNNSQKFQQAFVLSEKTKSRQLAEKIQAESYRSSLGLPDSLSQNEYNLNIDIAYYEKSKLQEKNKNTSINDSLIQVYQNKIFDLRQQRMELLNIFKEKYPTYFKARYSVDVISVEQVQQNLNTQQTLLEYFVGDNTIYLFLIQQNNYEIFTIAKDFPLDTLVENLRQGLYGYYSSSEDDQTEELEEQLNRQYITAAKQLYHHLLAPVADKLTQSLIIVPDGVLGYIPFEALLIEEVTDKYNYPTFPYLLNKHSISYTYSATLLQEMQQRQHLQKPSKELLAMAPFYAEGYSQTRDIISREVVLDTVAASSSIFSTNEFSPLPNSGIEVETISSIWTGDYFLGNDATEILFNDMASYYQILHLATHGQADYRYGDYSFLAFSQLPDSIENELLYVRDIYNLQLNADLVVLSACDAGIGELKKGEGVISLARAFAYAGAKSMVTSLWKVNDASTKDLMINLHQNLKSGMTKDQAVQQAKLKYISDQSEKDLSHPYFWGSFIAIGDMSPLTN